MRGFPPIQIFLLGLVFGLLALPLASLTGVKLPSFGGSSHAGHDHHDHDHDHDHGTADGDVKVVKGGDEHPEGEHKHTEVATWVRIRFAHAPQTLSLKQGDKEVLKQPLDLKQSPLEVKAELEVSHDGNEFILAATWPEGTPETAVTVELEPESFETRSETRWSSGTQMEEVLTFTW